MKYQGIKKIHEGKFITRYDVDYLTAKGRTKTYEIISRNKSIHSLEELQNHKADSVVMILTDENGDRILVSREYRMAMAQWIYNFPAGNARRKRQTRIMGRDGIGTCTDR